MAETMIMASNIMLQHYLDLKGRLNRSLSIWISLAVIAALIFSVSDVWADKARPLDLKTALETAVSLNSSLKQVMSRYRSAKAKVDAAMSAFFPKLNLNLSLSRSNNPVYAFGSKLNQASFTAQDFQLDVLNDPDYRTNWQTRFVLTQPIFNQGKEYIGYKMSKVGKDMAAFNETATKQSVFFMVEGSYFQALLAIKALKVLDQGP
ncbi:MAG: TolC family protein [Nitrospiraceae bacterium]|nr:TolC family protein [Nitrospiraceae bacterium]